MKQKINKTMEPSLIKLKKHLGKDIELIIIEGFRIKPINGLNKKNCVKILSDLRKLKRDGPEMHLTKWLNIILNEENINLKDWIFGYTII